ncbi:hypothetical protein SISNIDRAFT_467404 [Sistotremastrum niveocremeum HHB9708]|uniref:Uncharacterized protein n=2 Tax=Sistotremastraceae TaxID=3402574 RepID=A0A164SUE6_9AGAM|nr:hypothetical protein SISNIDRAFT_467404 [Sistotremastrum niveocremeum HHB9708]KZT40392.1 hypothetical protein SISSUDRAFT_1060319 [Sistotremastrum suecicum HHB10207 ss-3]
MECATVVSTADFACADEKLSDKHSFPDDGPSLVLEPFYRRTVSFDWELFPLRIVGSYTLNNLLIDADAQVFLPIKGWTTVYHLSGNLTEGISAHVDTPIAKGTVTVRIEEWEGDQWFTVIVSSRSSMEFT